MTNLVTSLRKTEPMLPFLDRATLDDKAKQLTAIKAEIAAEAAVLLKRVKDIKRIKLKDEAVISKLLLNNTSHEIAMQLVAITKSTSCSSLT
jgi:hypothetical protein